MAVAISNALVVEVGVVDEVVVVDVDVDDAEVEVEVDDVGDSSPGRRCNFYRE